MNRVRKFIRLLFIVAAIFLLIYINRKTNDNTLSVAEFKFNMYQKISKDSLDSKGKLNLLVDETSKYIEDSSHVQTGINYLTGLFGVLIVSELFFLMKGANRIT
jgi:hypothetical protein